MHHSNQIRQPARPTRARIARSSRARDGIILRDLDTGRIGFLTDPTKIAQVLPGQIYTIQITYDAGSWYKADLLELIHGPTTRD